MKNTEPCPECTEVQHRAQGHAPLVLRRRLYVREHPRCRLCGAAWGSITFMAQYARVREEVASAYRLAGLEAALALAVTHEATE